MIVEPNNIYNMDCIEGMKLIPDNSIDAIVTDPPYELGFMGKSWDKSGIANNIELWKEALRILKPGGHLLAFSGTRTYHRMASAIEDAGFEVRDMIEWVYGSGFPKSLSIGKAVDKLQGNEREVVGKSNLHSYKSKETNSVSLRGKDFEEANILSKGTSEWEGWGTALKPSHEPICMARKPLSEKTVTENCLKWGTGGLNIDGSRVEVDKTKETDNRLITGINNISNGKHNGGVNIAPDGNGLPMYKEQGRFPANLILEDCEEVRECFPDAGGGKYKAPNARPRHGHKLVESGGTSNAPDNYGDSGNTSRYFKSIIYIPKASKSERNRGCEELEEKNMDLDGEKRNQAGFNSANRKPMLPRANNHPTVKPIALMEYLINMITREGQIILDPFLGSGTTAVACINTNRQYIGFELLREYFQIAHKRIDKAIEDSNTLFTNYSKK